MSSDIRILPGEDHVIPLIRLDEDQLYLVIEEEIVHQTLVREAMRSLPRGPDPDPDDYVDEPTAQ